MAHLSNQTQRHFHKLQECIIRLKEINTLQNNTIHTLQEDYNNLSRPSDETNEILNQLLEEHNRSKIDTAHIQEHFHYIYQDINKLLNFSHKTHSKDQGVFHDKRPAPILQEETKTSVHLGNYQRSPSQYPYGDTMTYQEKKTFKQLPETES
ncbi:hypothetical protein O181_037506 [Austropuccinia psidii MF-1]|uniref:Uncharacterized protein n=1 Tax=Austropuccinia psidii MF-1 TaxID=1389203 RepID=A0A9Q3D6B4_9BASI|nr:hypothetical protein [Austropuccinia psidii MF-1]